MSMSTVQQEALRRRALEHRARWEAQRREVERVLAAPSGDAAAVVGCRSRALFAPLRAWCAQKSDKNPIRLFTLTPQIYLRERLRHAAAWHATEFGL